MDKFQMRRITFLLIIALCLIRCALHAPISEHIIFSDNEVTGNNLKFIGTNSCVSKSIYTSSFERKAHEKYGTERDSTLNSYRQLGISLLGFAYNIGDFISIGISTGVLFIGSGLDCTMKLTEKNYFTVSGNISPNFEVIFQRRMYFNGKNGFSFGAFFRHETQEFGTNIFNGSKQSSNLAVVNLGGIRGLFSYKSDRSNLRGIIGLGMETEYKTAVFIAGVSFLLFSRKQKEKESDIYDF